MELYLIKFQVGGVDFGVAIDEVQEVVSYVEGRSLPRSFPYVKGVFELRNRLILLVDLRRRFGAGSTKPTRNTHIIVVRLTGGLTGILVESISSFKRVSTEHIIPSIPLAGFRKDLLKGIYLHEDEVMILPDFNKILSSFIRIQLSPIDFSDQIAFRYRFDQGRLTRILEEIRLNQKVPFSTEQARTLARSMDLPPSQFFKMTSFYSCFHTTSSQASSLESSEMIRAGDQKYLQLSLRLEEEERKRGLDVMRRESKKRNEIEEWENKRLAKRKGDANSLKADLLELCDKKLPITFFRDLARKTNLSTTQLARFVSFYENTRIQHPISFTPLRRIKSEESLTLRELLSDKDRPLFELLYKIRDQQGYITEEDIRHISHTQEIPPVQICKLVSVLFGKNAILRTEGNNLSTTSFSTYSDSVHGTSRPSVQL